MIYSKNGNKQFTGEFLEWNEQFYLSISSPKYSVLHSCKGILGVKTL